MLVNWISCKSNKYSVSGDEKADRFLEAAGFRGYTEDGCYYPYTKNMHRCATGFSWRHTYHLQLEGEEFSLVRDSDGKIIDSGTVTSSRNVERCIDEFEGHIEFTCTGRQMICWVITTSIN
jgi:hypothetical protein